VEHTRGGPAAADGAADRRAAAAPGYDALPEVGGERCAWDYFGADDELGTLHWLSPEAVLAATREVTEGRVVNLDLPLSFGTGLVAAREDHHHEFLVRRSGMDEYLDGFYPQSSSQWDGFRHVRFREFGYFGGRTDDDALLAGRDLGVDAWARAGIVGRGVLVDVPAWAAATSRTWLPERREVVTTDILEAVLAWEGVELRPGDLLLVNTGWLDWYRSQDEAGRRAAGTVASMQTAGLDAAPSMAAWLWDHRVAAVAADNPALEALPVRKEVGFLHRRVLALLGLPIGELWDLTEASSACAELGRYTGLLTSSPLNLPGGVGTPSNAYLVL